MVAWWQRYWVGGLWLLTLLLGLSSYCYLGQKMGHPFGGLIIMKGGVVDVSTPIWWPGIVDGATTYHYHFKTIADQPYRREDVPLIFRQQYQQGNNETTVIFEYQDQLFARQLPVIPFGLAHYVDLIAARLITSLCFWLLAIIVYLTRPELAINRLFAITFSLFALNQALAHPSIFWDNDPGREFFLFFLWSWVTPFMGVTLVHFCLIFPQPQTGQRLFSLLYPLYGFVIFVSLFRTIDHLWRVAEPNWVGQLTHHGTSSYLLVGLCLLFVSNYYIWLRWASRQHRRIKNQLNIILTGLIITWLPVGLIFAHRLFEERVTIFWLGLDTRYFWISMPLALAYAILRYQSLHSANRLALVVLMMGSSAIVASLGASLLRWFEPSLRYVQTISPFVPLFIMGLLFGLIWSWHSSSRGPLAKLFHRQTLNYEAIYRLGNRLIGQTNLNRLPNLITEGLIEELQLERAVLYQWQPRSQQFHRTGQSGRWSKTPPNQLTPPAEWLSSPQPIQITEHQQRPAWLKPIDQLEFIQPLTAPTGILGLLGLGKRWDEEIFAQQDRQIVGLMAQQTALFLLTAHQIDELRQVPQRVAEAQEATHQKWNRELHDTTQQFLTRLPFFLQTGQLTLTSNPEKTAEILQRCIDDVVSEADNLRQIRNNMDPRQLQKSLAEPLESLCYRLSVRFELQIDYQFSPMIDRYTTVESRHALYRVIQQALDNVISHAQAHQVLVRVTYQTNRIEFVVQDNGRGFSEADRLAAQARGRFGLQSMSSRITTQGGELEVSGTPGEGTMVRGFLPVP